MKITTPKYILDVSKSCKYIQIVFVFACLFLLADIAHAQSMADLDGLTFGSLIEEASQPNDEQSLKIMKLMFGERYVNSPFLAIGVAETVIGALFFLYNGAIFVGGVSYFGVLMVQTIVRGATEGENTVGTRYSGSIMPIRIGLGIFGMVPAFSGYSALQGIGVLVLTAGIGLGNMGKNALISHADQMQSITPNVEALQSASGSMAGEVKGVAQNLFFSHLCVAVQNHGNAYFGTNDEIQIRQENFPGVRTMSFGRCGLMKLQRREGTKSRAADDFLAFRVGSVDYDAINTAAFYAASEQFDTLNLKMKALAEGLVRAAAQETEEGVLLARNFIGMAEATKSALDLIADESHRALTIGIHESKRGKLSALTPEVHEEMKRKGWTSVANYYQTFTAVSAAVADAQKAWEFTWTPGPTLTGIHEQLKKIDNVNTPYVLNNDTIGEGTIKILFVFFRDWQLFAAEQPSASDLLCADETGISATGDCSVGQSIVTGMIKAATDGSGGGSTVNIIYSGKQLGDFLMTFGMTVLVAGPAAKLAGLASVFIPGIGTGTAAATAAISMLMSSDTLRTLAWVAAGLGAVLSIYIPMIPGLTFFSGVVRYACSAYRHLAMFQLWGFAHLKDTGDEFAAGAAKRGYTVLVDMLLRPILMVLGFAASTALIVALGSLFSNEIFFPLMSNAAGNSMVGAGSIIALILIYCIVSFGLVQTITSACIMETPDAVVGWLGQTMDNSASPLLGASAMAVLRGARGGGGDGGGAGGGDMAGKAATLAKGAKAVVLKS